LHRLRSLTYRRGPPPTLRSPIPEPARLLGTLMVVARSDAVNEARGRGLAARRSRRAGPRPFLLHRVV